MTKKLIYLASRYDLVVGDRFELFYRGVIKSLNPYNYYIHISCVKGKYYPRYYTFTPNENDVGDYELTLTLYNDYHEMIEQGKTIIHVIKPIKPKTKKTILCFGDSLTFNGVWPYEGYRRFCETGGTPEGLGLKDSFELVGKCHYNGIGYEGFGGWKWKEFVDNEAVGISSSVWIKCKHNLDENDQHSVWKNNDKLWVLESITKDRIKFKRGTGNFGCSYNIKERFINVEGGIHKDDIIVEEFQYEETNPFYDEETKGPNFKKYCLKNNFNDLDYVYILLTWNGQYIAFAEEFSLHDKYIKIILNQIHQDFPKCKVRIMGIQSPAINGGITASYGCNGYYSDLMGDLWTAYHYNEYLEQICLSDEYKSFCRYIDIKAQFDVENNTPAVSMKVNNRCDKEELIGTNGVHPLMSGYLQIGDAFYRAIASDISDEENNKQ